MSFGFFTLTPKYVFWIFKATPPICATGAILAAIAATRACTAAACSAATLDGALAAFHVVHGAAVNAHDMAIAATANAASSSCGPAW